MQSQFNLENVTVFNTNEQESTLGQKVRLIRTLTKHVYKFVIEITDMNGSSTSSKIFKPLFPIYRNNMYFVIKMQTK